MGSCFSSPSGQYNSHYVGYDNNSEPIRSASTSSSTSPSRADQRQSTAQDELPRLEPASPRTLKTQRDRLLRRIEAEGTSFRASAQERQEFKAAYISQHATDHSGGKHSWDTEVWDLEYSVRQHKPELNNVAVEDMVALRAWTTQDYEIVQDVLEQDSEPTPEGLAYAKAITSGLHSLPDNYKYEGTVFTGENKSRQWVGERHKVGKVATSRRFFATAETKEAAWQGKRVDWRTHSVNGKSISAFSYHKEEREVLFPPGTIFRTNKVDTSSEPRKINIEQSEVES